MTLPGLARTVVRMRRPIPASFFRSRATALFLAPALALASSALILFAALAGAAAAGQPPPPDPGAGGTAGASTPTAPSGPAGFSGTGWFGHDSRLRVPQFNDEFPGVDLSALTPESREAFLHKANSEPCPCSQSGCDRHALAFCFKVDPGCPLARRLLVRMAGTLASLKP